MSAAALASPDSVIDLPGLAEIDSSVPVIYQFEPVPVLAQAWEIALPEAVLTIDPDYVPVLAHQSDADTAWRIEVTGQGRYWQWRRGRGTNRKSRYGGKFEQLSQDRQAAYHQNRRTKARTPAAASADTSG